MAKLRCSAVDRPRPAKVNRTPVKRPLQHCRYRLSLKTAFRSERSVAFSSMVRRSRPRRISSSSRSILCRCFSRRLSAIANRLRSNKGSIILEVCAAIWRRSLRQIKSGHCRTGLRHYFAGTGDRGAYDRAACVVMLRHRERPPSVASTVFDFSLHECSLSNISKRRKPKSVPTLELLAEGATMAADDRDGSAASQISDCLHGRLHCPKCADLRRLVHSFLDPTRGKTVALYECRRCGEHIWHE